ncbi:MAG: hypothetical protein IJJ91_00435 [Synergistaceae bacterium]|nr:hypothetical protein [Synergistaceae bacterium]MBQ6665104.1 hypothetical protein [Synergistaceae bacterium]MBR0248612.1 hypothetical protein [Synergistaceae bacterium]
MAKLIREKFGIINPKEYIEFEKRVDIVHKKSIDAYVPSTGIIIEQKSPSLDLAAFVQAKNFIMTGCRSSNKDATSSPATSTRSTFTTWKNLQLPRKS